jgi:hypothetical protein
MPSPVLPPGACIEDVPSAVAEGAVVAELSVVGMVGGGDGWFVVVGGTT